MAVSQPASAATVAHYTVQPFCLLPPSVVDAVFLRLSRFNLAECSLACKAWRHLPHAYLYSLSVNSYNIVPPAASLSLCCNLTEIHVSSSGTSQWAPFATMLSQQRLPALKILAIQHSSLMGEGQLLQLKDIMEVQGPQCCLHLAVTDKASLQALVPLLPFPGLVQLDFNVPYLPEGAAALLAETASLQTAAAASVASISNCCSRGGIGPNQPEVQQTQQQRFSIGVWVCCWGGCTGISLQDAAHIQQQLKAVECSMHSIESIKCSSSDDVVAIGTTLGHLKELRALGWYYNSDKANNSSMQSPEAAGRVAETGSGQPAGAGDKTNCGMDANTAALGALLPLSRSLQQLTIHGCPRGGFVQQQWAAAGADGNNWLEAGRPAAASRPCSSSSSGSTLSGTTTRPAAPGNCIEAQMTAHNTAGDGLLAHQHPLAALTGLTKLSLLKQWHTKPLPVTPISCLTALKELALERSGVIRPDELSCLSTLTQLKVLSLVLAVTADELVYEHEQGRWPLAATPVGTQAQQLVGTMQDLHLADQVAVLTDQRDAICTCFHDKDYSRHLQALADMAQYPKGKNSALRTEADTMPAWPTSLAAVQNQVALCPCSRVQSPALLDWRWLKQLRCLEVAWLQVPHIDLAFLPVSLTELDAQQPHDLTGVSITCSSRWRHGEGPEGEGVWLPNLRRLVLPRTLQVTRAQDSTAAEGVCDGLRCSTAEGGTDPLVWGGEDVVLNVSVVQSGATVVDTRSKSADTATDDNAADEEEQGLLQEHHNAQLLLRLCTGCPVLQKLEVVQWQLPSSILVVAAQQMRHLTFVSCMQHDDVDVREGLHAIRVGSVSVQLQEPLVLSSYPWSSVLSIH